MDSFPGKEAQQDLGYYKSSDTELFQWKLAMLK